MPKPDPALLDPARYPFACAIESRFGDLDINMHFNNVALTGMLEEARVRFHRESGYHGMHRGITSMVVSLSVEYLGQGFYPRPLMVHVGIGALGGSSHQLVQLAMQGDRPVAFARAVMATVRDGQSVPLPEDYRRVAADWMLRA